MKSLAAIQPSFLPWRGFFDIIHKVDQFVFYDDVQYERRSWRNRNKIKTPQGTVWLTVPVIAKGNYLANVNEILIDNSRDWKREHLETIRHSYRKAPYFEEYFGGLKDIYTEPWEKISELDIALTKHLAGLLGIKVEWATSSTLGLHGRKSERLVDLCVKMGATAYISGPSARDYIEPELFATAGITLTYQEYVYPAYPQLYGQFEPFVSVIDLLFNCGPQSPQYIWGDRS